MHFQYRDDALDNSAILETTCRRSLRTITAAINIYLCMFVCSSSRCNILHFRAIAVIVVAQKRRYSVQY